MRSRSWVKRVLQVVFVLLLMAGAMTIWLFHSGWNARVAILLGELRVAPAALPHYASLIEYWVSFLGKLRYNPATGVSDFEWLESTQEPLSDYERARLQWHRGNFISAIESIEAHHAVHGESRDSLFWLAMAYFRQAEQGNCLARLRDTARRHDGHGGAHAGMCTLPLTEHHTHPLFARRAARLFERYLDEYDGEDLLVRWLLNFSWMTIDGFPEQVPPVYRIDTPFIELFYGERAVAASRRHDGIVLTDRAAALGVDTLDAGKGVAVEDFDNDGYLDIITGGFYTGVKYYRNQAGKGFEEVAEQNGLAGIRGNHIITAADYDGDGWMDLFIARPIYGDPIGGFSLMRNLGNGSFADVTHATGLDGYRRKGQQVIAWTSAWADIDLDGDLDLFVAHLGDNMFDSRPPLTSRLYRNDGERFVDVTDTFGVSEAAGYAYVTGAAFGDYDGDGDMDLFLTNVARGRSLLLRNESGQRFVRTNAIDALEPGFMTAFLDVDHDFDLDLFVGGSGPARSVTNMTVFGEEWDKYKLGHSLIWMQENGVFRRRSDLFRDGLPATTMGAGFGDINNDGAIDYYLGTGGPEGWMILPNLMYLGEIKETRPTGYTDNISMLNGMGTIQKGHGIVFFDFDNDGDQDIYSSLGGMWPGDEWPNQLFVNQSRDTGAWVKIRLRGTRANRHGLGARIRVRARNTQGKEITRTWHMDNGTGFGSSPYQAHIGLADATSITDVEVRWPGERRSTHYSAQINTATVLTQSGE